MIQYIFILCFFTGMRPAEVLNLTWKQIRLTENLIQVGSSDFITKSKKIRFIPISQQIREVLAERFSKILKPENQFVFPNSDKLPYSVSTMSHVFKRLVRKVNLPEDVHLYSLRVSFGSYLLQQGVPISVISKLYGHSSIAITERHYTSLTSENLFSAISHFNKIEINADKKAESNKQPGTGTVNHLRLINIKDLQ